MTTEDEAQRATMQLLGGLGVLRGGNWHSGGLLYHLGVGCHVGVFQGIDGAHYTVLTVVGRRLGRERRHSKWTHTHTYVTHTDALELYAFQGMGLMLVDAPRLLSANRVNERVSATEWPLDHPFYCLTNSLCLRHLTAQRDPWGRGERQGGRGRKRRGRERLNSSREWRRLLGRKRAATLWVRLTKGGRLKPTQERIGWWRHTTLAVFP